MARDKKQSIIDLELLTRSSPLYSSFEDRTEDLNKTEIFNIFREEMKKRAKNLDFIKKWQEVRDISIEDKENHPLIYNKKFEKLKVIDIDFYSYYNNLMENLILQPLENSIKRKYSIQTMIDEPILVKVLGEQRVHELLYDGFPKEIQDNKGFPYLDFEYLLTILEKDEAIKIKKHIKSNLFGFRTMALNHAIHDRDLTKSLFVEIDFSKPIEEIERFIKLIKDDFEDKTKKPTTMYNLLGIKDKRTELNIHKRTNKKTINQLFADILFIFDCYKAKYTQEDIQIEFKNYYKYGIKKESIKKYFNYSKKFL